MDNQIEMKFTQKELVDLTFAICAAINATRCEINRCESLPEKDEEMKEYIEGLKLQMQRQQDLKYKVFKR